MPQWYAVKQNKQYVTVAACACRFKLKEKKWNFPIVVLLIY